MVLHRVYSELWDQLFDLSRGFQSSTWFIFYQHINVL